jgi:polyphosphate glucokinase
VRALAPLLMEAFLADDVVLGGGNARKLHRLPPGTRLGQHQTAFRGGFRLWTLEDVQTLSGHEKHQAPPLRTLAWRLL